MKTKVEIYLSEIGYEIDFFDSRGVCIGYQAHDFDGRYDEDTLLNILEMIYHDFENIMASAETRYLKGNK